MKTSPNSQLKLSADQCVAQLVLVPGPSAGLEVTPGKAAPRSQEHGHRHGFSIPTRWTCCPCTHASFTTSTGHLLRITTLKSILVSCSPSLWTLEGIGVGTAPCRQVFHWEKGGSSPWKQREGDVQHGGPGGAQVCKEGWGSPKVLGLGVVMPKSSAWQFTFWF